MRLPIDETACDIFGRERGRLRREGKTIGDFGLLIADLPAPRARALLE